MIFGRSRSPKGCAKVESSGDLFVSTEEAAQQHAASWAMIPMTRAMDTLVIQISPANTPIHAVLRDCCRAAPRLRRMGDAVNRPRNRKCFDD